MLKMFCARGGAICFLGLVVTGCVQTKITEPSRSAVEQLLLSTAADRATATVHLDQFRGKRVHFSTNYFEAYDAKYALGSLREALSRSGALLVEELSEADVVIEARSAALSIDSVNSILGIPSTVVPIPVAGTFSLPEVALMKSQKQDSMAKFALLAFSPKSGEHVFSSGPMLGRAKNHYYQFLWIIKFTKTDLPERMKAKKVRNQNP